MNKNETKHDGSFDNHIETLVLTERLDLDITDLLWNVLKNVEVDKVISRLFILLFNEMKTFFLNENHSIRQMRLRMQSYFSFLF